MTSMKTVSCALILVFAQAAFSPCAAEAGPLLNWLRGLRNRGCNSQPCGYQPMQQPVASCGLQPGQCQVSCNQTCSRVVVNYVPYTAYRTAWEQVPVTQYKPVTNSDPCTGCTVTCMKPCTTYNWQMKQVPYTTYRPVYRTENYTVPVSYVTQAQPNCSTCAVPGSVQTNAVPGCSTCNVGDSTAVPQSSSFYNSPGSTTTDGLYYGAPTGTNAVLPTGAVPTPADTIPVLNGVNPQTMQRPVLEQLQSIPAGSSNYRPVQVPAGNLQTSVLRSTSNMVPSAVVSDVVPIRQTWGYTPVKLASYTTVAPPSNAPESARTEVRGSWQNPNDSAKKASVNSDWKSVNW